MAKVKIADLPEVKAAAERAEEEIRRQFKARVALRERLARRAVTSILLRAVIIVLCLVVLQEGLVDAFLPVALIGLQLLGMVHDQSDRIRWKKELPDPMDELERKADPTKR